MTGGCSTEGVVLAEDQEVTPEDAVVMLKLELVLLLAVELVLLLKV